MIGTISDIIEELSVDSISFGFFPNKFVVFLPFSSFCIARELFDVQIRQIFKNQTNSFSVRILGDPNAYYYKKRDKWK